MIHIRNEDRKLVNIIINRSGLVLTGHISVHLQMGSCSVTVVAKDG